MRGSAGSVESRNRPRDAKRASRAVWGATPAGAMFGGGAEPGTREFFEAVLERRSSYEMPWLPALVPFSTFVGKRVLEIGCGAGYDAYEFMRHGADYTGIDIAPENVDRVRMHLAHFGFRPQVMEADAENLPFADGTFDIVYANGVLHHTPDMPRSFREAFRVLRPGGEFYVVVYNRNSIYYKLSLALVEQLLKGGFRERSLRTRLAMVEYSTSDELPLVQVHSPRQVRAILAEAGFKPVATAVRKLVAMDLPSLPYVRRLWSRIPQSWLDRLGNRWGWYVIARARRPIN